MGIDFDDPVNRRSYSDRSADDTWSRAARLWVDPTAAVVVDVGCGGGIYTRAWAALGAATVIGVDSSSAVLAAARDSHGHLPAVRFHEGDASRTGLAEGSADVVFARALVHHTPDLCGVVAEARRLLRPGGVYLVQDRTLADASQPGSPTHPRGWLLDVFPRLLEVESARRPSAARLTELLVREGLVDVSTETLWEIRQRYDDREDYLAGIAGRTGRSILHHLADDELAGLVAELRRRLPAGPLVEEDRWTIWRAVRPPADASGPASGPASRPASRPAS